MANFFGKLWQFLASVKLAMITLLVLACTSIIGTLIVQGKDSSYYIEEFGPALAQLITSLGLSKMYTSWWFITLLFLFAVNLVVCSIERLPAVWRMVRRDNLSIDPEKLQHMEFTHELQTSLTKNAAVESLHKHLKASGFKKPQRNTTDSSTTSFVQTGAWSRLGVYVVHLSILVIFTGSLIGNILGFKAYVFLPEGRTTKEVYRQGSAETIPLGFELRCDHFEPMIFKDGRLQGERTFLTVIASELQKPLSKSIIVNDPLTYKGVTFYKADSYPLEGFYIQLSNQANGMQQAFRIPANQDVTWPAANITFRVDEVELDENDEVIKAKIAVSDPQTGDQAEFWIGNNRTTTIERPDGQFTFLFRQLYSSLLLATKDPGVWVFYFGCILMVFGLMICFVFSHRRLWIQVTDTKAGSLILLSATANKQKFAFEKIFKQLVGNVLNDRNLSGSSKKHKK